MDPHAPLMASLRQPRYEIIPMRGVEEQLDHLPADAVVTVTASPTRGLEPTLDLATVVAARGHRVVPHLAARSVSSGGHLAEVLARIRELGAREVFVVAGDRAQQAGPYAGAVELLAAMAEHGHQLEEVGISGYPERHPFLDDRTTIEAMTAKSRYATYIVSQICYEPAIVRSWITAVRARGIELPIHVGLPGVVDRRRLLRLSVRLGLGDPLRYLSKQSETAGRLLRGYQPDALVHGLADLAADPARGVAGWHLFTFNEVARTDEWRRQLLATLAEETAL